MKIILERGDSSEQINFAYSLRGIISGIEIIDKTNEHIMRALTDLEIQTAIMNVMRYFSVSSQWVAIYRILVDYHHFPADISLFYKRMCQLMHGTRPDYPPDYQSIQKPLAASGILQKSFEHWEQFTPPKGDRVFSRQKMIADKFMQALDAPESEAYNISLSEVADE